MTCRPIVSVSDEALDRLAGLVVAELRRDRTTDRFRPPITSDTADITAPNDAN